MGTGQAQQSRRVANGEIAANDISQLPQDRFDPFQILLRRQGFFELPDHMQTKTGTDYSGRWTEQGGNEIFAMSRACFDGLEIEIYDKGRRLQTVVLATLLA